MQGHVLICAKCAVVGLCTAFALTWPPRIYVLETEESGFASCRDNGVQHVLELWAVEAAQFRLGESVVAYVAEDADFVLVAQCFTQDFLAALHICRARGGTVNSAEMRKTRSDCFAAKELELNTRMLRFVRAVVRSPLHRRRNGTDFVLVTGTEDGRLAFPAFEHPSLRNWAFAAHMGPSSWLRAQAHAADELGTLCPWPEYPEVPWDVVLPTPSIHNLSAPGGHRPRLAFFSGHDNSCARRALFGSFGCDLSESGVAVCHGGLGRRYGQLLRESRFCFVPDGRSAPWTGRFMEVLRAGCVPVVVSDVFHPPFHRSIEWASAAIFARVAEVPQLEARLAAVSSEALQHWQSALHDLAVRLDPREGSYWELLLNELHQGASARVHRESSSLQTLISSRAYGSPSGGCGRLPSRPRKCPRCASAEPN